MLRRDTYFGWDSLEKRTSLALEENTKLRFEIERLKKHVGKLTEQVEANTNYGKRNSKAIENIRKEVGVTDGSIFFSWLTTTDNEIKPFNLKEKVEAIMAHLGLIELAETENKLIPIPKKKKETK
jgi:hypothetical protein